MTSYTLLHYEASYPGALKSKCILSHTLNYSVTLFYTRTDVLRTVSTCEQQPFEVHLLQLDGYKG